LKRFFVLLCILLNVIGTAFTQSRAAMLGFLIGIFLLAFSNLRHRIYQILPILLIFVLAIFYIANNAGFDLAQRFTPEYLEETEQAGAIPRTVLFSTGLKIFMDNPWGHGFGSMHDLMYQNLGEEISVHNIFLELAIEHGILGLLASLWLAWLSTGRLWKILNRKEVDPETRWLAMGFFTIMVTIWINFLAHAFVAWIPLWIIFGMLAAFVYQAEQKKSMIHAG
jgi:O-antigen ligase